MEPLVHARQHSYVTTTTRSAQAAYNLTRESKNTHKKLDNHTRYVLIVPYVRNIIRQWKLMDSLVEDYKDSKYLGWWGEKGFL